MSEFKELIGKTITSMTGDQGDEEIIFTLDNGDQYKMYHYQDCCESVNIEDICGNIDDILNSPILIADESESQNETPEGVSILEYQDSFTWTFYRLGTIKGDITIRWYGSSNGYYSESVTFKK
jgi:hypothetical protein